MRVIDFFDKAVLSQPDRIAFVSKERSYTYREMQALSLRIARAIDAQGQIDVAIQVVPEGPVARAIEFSWSAVGGLLVELAGQFGDPAQVFRIGVSLSPAEADDLIEHLRHPVIEGGIMGVFADDRATDVVFDGLLNRCSVADSLAEALVEGLGDTRFDDQLQQADVIEGGDLAGLIGLDIGVDQVAHIGFVGLEV